MPISKLLIIWWYKNYVYSSEDEEEGENEEDENYSHGVYTFIRAVKKRKNLRRNIEAEVIDSNNIGIEDRVVAAATFKKKYV